MILKRLDIVGFKSFTERCTVPFSPGISAVVGPNGCGKSNIIDAIRWVMGEQSPRLLRARNMEDILFNGSKGKAPAALAEVTLTLSRDQGERGSAEIAVTRRLFRGGDSDYLINRSQSRLKDVLRFFIEAGMGTRSYAIIEQERVGRLVDARPEERRLLMDEAAGITRYKEQKKESERKLETATQNLATIAGIMAESKKQLGIVARAASKAQRHRAIKEELRGLELSLSAQRFLDLGRRQRDLRAGVAGHKELLAALIAKASGAELEAQALRNEDNRAADELEAELGAFHALEGDSKDKEAEARRLGDALATARAQKSKAEAELSGQGPDREGYEKEIERLRSQLETLPREHDEAKARAEEAKAAHALIKGAHETARARAQEASRALEGLKSSLARQNEELASGQSLSGHLRGRRESMGLEREGSAQALEEAKAAVASRERRVEALKEELKGLSEELSTLREDESRAKGALDSLLRSLGPAESKATALRARLETLDGLQASHAWYPRGVGALMADKSLAQAGLLGAVAENIDIPEGYEEAAEAALGDRLSYLAVRDRGAALAALRLAKEKSLGRCGFVIGGGAVKGALTRELLGPFELLESLEGADALPGDGVFLTRDGSFLSPGLAAGGRDGQKEKEAQAAGVLQRLRERERTKDSLEAAQRDLDHLKAETQRARGLHREAQEALADKGSERDEVSAQLGKASSNLSVAVSEERGASIRHGSLDSQIRETEGELAKVAARMEKGALEKSRLEGLVSAAQADLDAATAASEGQAEELGEVRERESAALAKADAAKAQLEAANRELQGFLGFLLKLDLQKEGLERDIAALSEQIESSERGLAALQEELAPFPGLLEESAQRLLALKEGRERNKGLLESKEEGFRLARKEREAAALALNSLEKDLLEADFALASLRENLLRDWRVVFLDPDAPPEPDPEPDPLPGPAAEGGPGPDDGDGPKASADDGQGHAPKDGPAAGEDAALGHPEAGAGPTEGQEGQDGPDGEAQGPPEIKDPDRLDPRDFLRDDLPDDSPQRVERLKARVAAFGEVNLAAIEEEAELRKRFEFYQAQHDDLQKAIADLRETIGQINRVCRERFNLTFSQVDQKFQEIFPVLFEGGEGWLALSEHSDPLEAGVEIHVHPPGKKIMVMSLLSGGEKALTALALIFALYLIKPSPFCLLDEADAPLDEANIDRFNRLLRKLSEASQIIMVTHNKRTMQISDTLYGVTMETPGVSRLVSVSLSQAQVLTKDV